MSTKQPRINYIPPELVALGKLDVKREEPSILTPEELAALPEAMRAQVKAKVEAFQAKEEMNSLQVFVGQNAVQTLRTEIALKDQQLSQMGDRVDGLQRAMEAGVVNKAAIVLTAIKAMGKIDKETARVIGPRKGFPILGLAAIVGVFAILYVLVASYGGSIGAWATGLEGSIVIFGTFALVFVFVILRAIRRPATA